MRSLLLRLRRLLSRRWSALHMQRVDDRPIPPFRHDEIRLFLLARNEDLRLPFLFEYYRRLGVDRFFVVDNNSDDGSLDFLVQQPDCHIWRTRQSYKHRAAWREALLNSHGLGGWSLIVDADEFLVNPLPDCATLHATCRLLDAKGYDCFPALMLDMFSKGPLSRTGYLRGHDPLLSAPWCDVDSIREIDAPQWFKSCKGHIPKVPFGGVRERVFGNKDICLSKMILVRYHRGIYTSTSHTLEGVTLPDLRGLLLHFKHLQDFLPRAVVEASRGEHYDNAAQYKVYAQHLDEDRDPVLWQESSQEIRWDSGPATNLVHVPDWFQAADKH